MTFEQWYNSEGKSIPLHVVEAAWNYQQSKINALQKQRNDLLEVIKKDNRKQHDY